MEVQSNNEALVSYKLSNVDHEKLTGVLTVVNHRDGEVRLLSVSITKPISSWILHQEQGRLTKAGNLYTKINDVFFTSTNTSPVFEENPFSLHEWKDINGNHINYKLVFVTSKLKVSEVADLFGNKETVKSYRRWKQEQFRRYVSKTNTQFVLDKPLPRPF